MARTHSRPLTWIDICEEAFGSGLHPWEFYEYTLEEFIWRRSGSAKRRKIELQQEFQHFRILSRFVIQPYLSKTDQKKSTDRLIPDIYEPAPQKKDIMVWYAEMKERISKMDVGNGKRN